MSAELLASIVLGVLGLLAAYIERRDGWRYVALAERHDRELAELRERVARLEERGRA